MATNGYISTKEMMRSLHDIMKNKPSDTTTQRPDRDSPADDISDIEAAAEAYLDLWQENIKRWAREPEALKKWLANAGRTPPEDQTPDQ